MVKLTAKNFPYVTVTYMFLIIIVNTLVKTKFPGNKPAAELYSTLYDKGFGFLIPFIDILFAPGLFINSGEYSKVFYIASNVNVLVSILVSGIILEMGMGSSKMLLLILIAMVSYYFIYIFTELYFNTDISTVSIPFKKYNCCSTGVVIFLVGAAITALLFLNKKKLDKRIIYGFLLAGGYIGYYLYDYFTAYKQLELKYIKGERKSYLREIYKEINMSLVAGSFFGNSLFYVFGFIASALLLN